MTYCQVEKSLNTTTSDLEKIRQYTTKDFDENELFIFNLTLCSNDVDRDYEKFSIEALHQLQKLFVGKTGISDHSMKSADQKARIFDTFVEKQQGKTTLDGEPLYCLKAKAYMVRNDENQSFITEIEAGIKKEISVSCSMGSNVCSVCGNDRNVSRCSHVNGKVYDSKLCYGILSDARDAYEFSFVAVPAQRGAGVTKSFCVKGDCDMTEIINTIKSCDCDVTISKSQAHQLCSYIENLEEEAKLGEEYKKSLVKEVTGLCAVGFPEMDAKIFGNVASVMTTAELKAFRDGFKKAASKSIPKPQILPNEKSNKTDYSQFRI